MIKFLKILSISIFTYEIINGMVYNIWRTEYDYYILISALLVAYIIDMKESS